MLWTAIIGILPSLASAALTAYNKSKDVTITAYQASVGIAASQADYMKEVLGHPLSPPSLMCYGVAFHFIKAVAWDPILAPFILGRPGFTPALSDGTNSIAMIVVSGMFFSGIASIIKR